MVGPALVAGRDRRPALYPPPFATGDDFLHPIITFIQRFEVDRKRALFSDGLVPSTPTNEVRFAPPDLAKSHPRPGVAAGPYGKGAGLRCLQSALNNAVVLSGKKPFGMNTHKRTLSSSVLVPRLRSATDDSALSQVPDHSGDYPVEHFFRGTGEAVLFTRDSWLSIRAHIIGVRVSDTTLRSKSRLPE